MKKYKDLCEYDFSDYAEERSSQRNEYYIKKYNINPYLPTDVKIKLVQKELDHQFALAVSSYIGTNYVFGGKSRKGIDCSGTITESLKDMGYKIEDKSASNMVNGKVNQTYAPFSTNEQSYPVVQARINWEVLDEKYRF